MGESCESDAIDLEEHDHRRGLQKSGLGNVSCMAAILTVLVFYMGWIGRFFDVGMCVTYLF